MWSSEESALLIAILDELIPGNPECDIPGAGEAGIAAFVFERATGNKEFHECLSSLLHDAQQMADKVTTDLVRQLEECSPEAFQALLTETYKGYYSRADLRAKFGVGAHPVHPEGYAVDQETPDFLAELTGPVVARGPVFRDSSGDKQ